MKKIAFIITDFDRLFSPDGIKGGGSHVMKNIIENWRNDSDVILDIYTTKTNTFEFEGINKIVKIPICQYGNIEGFIEELKKHTEKENYDNILFGEVIAPYASVMLQAHSFPYRYDLYGGIKTKFFKHLKKKKIENQRKAFSRENNIYIAMSEKIKKDYAKNFDISEANIKVAYPGVKMPEENIKTKKNKITFGIVGSSNVNKGAYRFLEALSKVKKHNKNIKAVMICNNYKRLHLLRFLIWFYRVKNDIEILDFQSDMSDFYKKTDCIVMPSRHEAFGLVPLEGASYKAIPLVSNNTGFAEIIEETKNGFIFDINKQGIKNLADKMNYIADLYHNNYEEFSKAQEEAYNLAKEFSWERFSNTILESL